MSAQIMVTAWSRLHRRGLVNQPRPPSTQLTQFRRGGRDALPGLDRQIVVTDTDVEERPPLRDVVLAGPAVSA
jgi:glucosyl-3-phosphoglycerate synthase